jgi:hypothetical protein
VKSKSFAPVFWFTSWIVMCSDAWTNELMRYGSVNIVELVPGLPAGGAS